ncbi:hypothetical protein CHGG_07650 [Paecilomyces variotii No. 5]|uniref:Short-chain dehydrogenases/reductase n=1 Tax=Byssochlamys spectabilis (strain No. 5 / NBRC 109023) TaxID=1356009 RepID=V5FUC2_BYSSN|nr:hypothetical protein CHGG_07650 [Paecilomyces variotii No. 5]
MVDLESMRKSNAKLGQYFTSCRPVAVFVGATNGIGRNAVRSFARSTRGCKPRIYFVGRSHQRGHELKEELVAINPDGEYDFISADVGEMAAVDDVCRQIMDREEYLNLLFMSQGTADHETETSEKLRLLNAAVYYSKIRFAVNLLPLLKNAPVLRRVVSVFAAGLEGKVVVDDLDGRKISRLSHRDNLASMLSLATVQLSEEVPEVSFVHNFPGAVESGLWESMPGFLGVIIRTLAWVLGRFWYMDPEECGQRQIFMATSARFPAATMGDDGNANGVDLLDGMIPAVSLNGNSSGAAYSVNEHADAISEKKADLLRRCKSDGTQDVVWRHTMETFKRITGKERL